MGNCTSAGGGGVATGGKNNIAAFTDTIENNPSNALSQLSQLIENSTISNATFTANGNSVRQQAVTISNGNDRVEVYFNSRFEPTQVTNPAQPIKTGIYATVWKNGNAVAQRTIAESKTKSIKNARTQYENMLDTWKKATKQKQIRY